MTSPFTSTSRIEVPSRIDGGEEKHDEAGRTHQGPQDMGVVSSLDGRSIEKPSAEYLSQRILFGSFPSGDASDGFPLTNSTTVDPPQANADGRQADDRLIDTSRMFFFLYLLVFFLLFTFFKHFFCERPYSRTKAQIASERKAKIKRLIVQKPFIQKQQPDFDKEDVDVEKTLAETAKTGGGGSKRINPSTGASKIATFIVNTTPVIPSDVSTVQGQHTKIELKVQTSMEEECDLNAAVVDPVESEGINDGIIVTNGSNNSDDGLNDNELVQIRKKDSDSVQTTDDQRNDDDGNELIDQMESGTCLVMNDKTETYFKQNIAAEEDDKDDEDKIEEEEEEVTLDVSNSCLICLEKFQPNETVCSSNNPNCIHTFHFGCIESWLMKHDECPCCRCTYLVQPEKHRRRVRQKKQPRGRRRRRRRRQQQQQQQQVPEQQQQQQQQTLQEQSLQEQPLQELPLQEQQTHQGGNSDISIGDDKKTNNTNDDMDVRLHDKTQDDI